MTKQLLTTLLIAGISATAKAEPTVYYCEMKSFADFMHDGEIVNYKLERFTMKVESKKVSFGGDGYLEGHERPLDFEFRLNDEFFTSSAFGGIFEFRENILRVAQMSIKDMTTLVARCDKF